MKLKKQGFTKSLLASAILSVGLVSQATGQEMEEIVVKGDLGSLPGENVESVFGFNKSILETPRSASTVSEEMMDRFGMHDIDELVAVAPGTFTQSFFGVAGGLDVRGTAGETYFRGVKRLDNPGNYPTPIGASSRVDIVRGPASPIYGPSKIGGYLNFNPKSARIEETGQFIPENTGALSFTVGSWDKSIITAEVGGPAKVGDQEFGYYFYGESENSGSYYDNASTDNNLLQAAFDMDISDNIRVQFGGMWHDYQGNQNAGWNRLTQDLIDNGTYVTGTAKPLDTNGDGQISHQEYDVVGADINPFLFDFLNPDAVNGSLLSPSDWDLDYLRILCGCNTDNLALVNPGTAQLDGNQTLIAPDDVLENTVTTLYFDVLISTESGWDIKNQLFYEQYDNLNENAYGFSQFHDTWVVENKLIFSKTFERDTFLASVQISPSFRHTDFRHGEDFFNEYFHRRDLTTASSALDKRVLSTRIDDDYAGYDVGEYTNWGLAFLADLDWENGFNAVIGVRHDIIDLESRTPQEFLQFPNGLPEADDEVDGTSWTVSLSYNSDIGLIPYITASTQSTLVAGQGAEVGAGQIATGSAFDDSELLELGLKGSLIDNSLYFAIAIYEQERTDFSAQNIVTNQSTFTEGVEMELRWVVNENLLVTAGYSHVEVTNLQTERDGYLFSFYGADDLPLIPDHLLYGGQVIGFIDARTSDGGRRAGIPENILSVTATYDFGNGLAVSGSIIDVDEAPSGLSNAVILPDYTLVNLGVSYETENWLFTVSGKNLTDEEYFRANFPNLFGTTIVLPELPRHYQARMQYRF